MSLPGHKTSLANEFGENRNKNKKMFTSIVPYQARELGSAIVAKVFTLPLP